MYVIIYKKKMNKINHGFYLFNFLLVNVRKNQQARSIIYMFQKMYMDCKNQTVLNLIKIKE